MRNAFPICRSIFDHWIYCDSDYLKIWITMLGKARYMKEPKTGLYQKIKYTLNYGEFIFGRLQWSKDLGIGEQKIRTCLKKLVNDNMIEIAQKSSKFTIYKIVNYEKFNQQDNQQESIDNKEIEKNDNHQANQQVTDKQPSTNQQVTTNEECKEGCKNDKNIINLSAEQTPYSKIRELFIKNCPTLPVIKDIKDNRQKVVKARWKERPNLEFFNNLFKMVDESNFLSGRDGKWDKCCFDWIMKPANMQKIIEGNYKNKDSTKSIDEFSLGGV